MKKQNEQRKNILMDFGFGTDVMKSLVVCKKCRSLETIDRVYCSSCNTKLDSYSLFELYKSQHNSCMRCGTVLSSNMGYCPRCGAAVAKIST